MNRILLLLFIAGFISSCTTSEDFDVEGYKPVYISRTAMVDVRAVDPEPLINPGKIYIKPPYVFINEVGKGVHIVDNSNPESPVIVSFINIPGNKDIAVKNNILYADNISDLIAINISDFHNVQVVKRIENVYPRINELYPNEVDCYFECVDTSKGYVVDWEKTMLTNPMCQK